LIACHLQKAHPPFFGYFWKSKPGYAMKIGINVWWVTLSLASIAGFCDTITFVSADQVFSAHVTGNFIVFAYDVVTGSDVRAWTKLITLPVFIIAVMTAGWMIGRRPNRWLLLLTESILLIAGGLIAALRWPVYLVVTLVVFAMGLQNAFGRIFSKETHGPTTMMTGNVTQAALDIGTLFRKRFKDEETRLSLKKLGVNIGGFLGGCLLGAVLGKQIGLPALALPGLLLGYCYLIIARSGRSHAYNQ
jgi:uncharacterized membrane protein YoaK (UPF0700 family)